MKNFLQPGRIVSVIAPYNVLSGGLVLVGGLFGAASHDALSGAPVEICTEGVYTFAKVSAQAWTQGVALYFDVAAKLVTTDAAAGANTAIGHAVAAASNPSATGSVRLSI